jgi:tetratricopeptide (TPR) repeat protein
MPSRAASTRILACLLATLSRQALAEPQVVIPAGRERELIAILGGDGQVAGCSLHGLTVNVTIVRATWTCPGSQAPVAIELRHPDDPAPAAARTVRFSIVAGSPSPPGALVEQVAGIVRKREASWTWETVTPKVIAAPPDPGSQSPPPPGAGTQGPDTGGPSPQGLAPGDQAVYDRCIELLKERRAEEAYPLLHELAAREPRFGTLSALVPSIAGMPLTWDVVRAFEARAESAPDDPLASFEVGVAAHYLGHGHLLCPAEKRRAYEMSAKYLERIRSVYADEPRLWIYLAVSYRRLGRQSEAEAAIDRAVALGTRDADAFYCRAEVWHRKDIGRAVQDIHKYLDIMEVNVRGGALHSSDKETKVRHMLAILEESQRNGTPLPESDFFDPSDPAACDGTATAGRSSDTQALWLGGGVALAGAALALVLALRARRRFRQEP